MTKRVDIKIAELLHKNGWTENTYSHCWVKTLDGEVIHNSERKNIPEHDRCETYLMQPTLAEVAMWLYDKHGIWISPHWYFSEKFPSTETHWDYSLDFVGNRGSSPLAPDRPLNKLKSPIEALEHAIEYALRNIITGDKTPAVQVGDRCSHPQWAKTDA